MDKVIELLKSTNIQISKTLLFNYKKLNITDQEFIVLIYLINENVYNPKQIGNDLDIAFPEVLEIINNLTEKGILKIELAKINNIRTEVINLDTLYEKLAFLIIKDEKEVEKPKSLFDTFETELGRTLSPMEYEIINGWLTTCSEEIIILALKEATYNGVSNFRYIDRIINEWNKKGIKTKEDVEKNRLEFKNKKDNKKQELFDYDWLNDNENN